MSLAPGIALSISVGIVLGMNGTDKVRENRLRRAAARQGLALVKRRRFDPRALDFGLFVLISLTVGDVQQAAASAFERREGKTLDQIEQELTGTVSTQDLPARQGDGSSAGQAGAAPPGGQKRK